MSFVILTHHILMCNNIIIKAFMNIKLNSKEYKEPSIVPET